VVPVPVIDLGLRGFDFDRSRAHVQQQIQPSVQQLHGKEVHLGVLLSLGVPPVLSLALGEEDQAVGFGRTEVKGDGSDPLGVPFGQGQRGLWILEADGVQRWDVLTFEDDVALNFHLRVHDAGETRQLQADIVVFVHHLEKKVNKTQSLVNCIICFMSQRSSSQNPVQSILFENLYYDLNFLESVTEC
uniref:Uncharacterized protein n=1 Tax=Neogobius melanostomus TaxID=47308 RepID=A0A8C6U5U1_9GOBI